jgi:hypothetical protein
MLEAMVATVATTDALVAKTFLACWSAEARRTVADDTRTAMVRAGVAAQPPATPLTPELKAKTLAAMQLTAKPSTTMPS